jgi:hypothetical protein
MIHTVQLDSEAWTWGPADGSFIDFRGRSCIAFDESVDLVASLAGVELTDGMVEVDLALARERAFHGVLWRLRDDENYESFFVRPHQVANPDAVQYTPVFNGVSAWQLYHGPGFWAPIAFPFDEWFSIRVVFSGARAEVFVADMDHPALEVGELRAPIEAGRIGLMIGGPGLRVARFAYSDTPLAFRGAEPQPVSPLEGVVPGWLVSDAFTEPDEPTQRLAPAQLAERTWSRLESEPSGLVNLARSSGIHDGRNTVWARTTIQSDRTQLKPMALGFSDRAVVYLNGQALYRGDDTYQSRDYRFLGTMGYYDTVYLPLIEGDNELVVAVSETFGGWGIQARFVDLAGINFG